MQVTEIQAKSLLRRQRKIDSWFISQYGMNLYRGCAHDCAYCDGRAEKYQVNGEFGTQVTVKINAIDLLNKELNLRRRQKIYNHGFIMVGGGVGDSYQPVEEQYQLTRKTLHFLSSINIPVHILTKSTLVERDIDILKSIEDHSKALISFSFSSTNDEISSIFEPGVPPPTKRLDTIKTLKKEGFTCGIYLLPVIPFVTDTAEALRQTIHDASNAGIDYLLFGGMTLKKGRQKTYFYDLLSKHYPDLISQYEQIFPDKPWGNASTAYYQSINQSYQAIMKQYPIPKCIPATLFNDYVTENDRVTIILEQIDYLLRLKGRRSPYGYAAYQISKQKENLSSIISDLQQIKGVGKVTEKIIREIIETKTAKYYEQLLTA